MLLTYSFQFSSVNSGLFFYPAKHRGLKGTKMPIKRKTPQNPFAGF